DYTEAMRLQPTHADAYTYIYNSRAWAKSCIGDYAGAIADRSEAIRLKPDDAIMRNGRALLYELTGDAKKSQADRQQAALYESTQYTPTEKLRLANQYKRWADLLNSRGEHAQALVGYQETIRLNPDFAEAYYHRGLAYYLQGNTSAAQKNYLEAVRLKP